MRLYDVYWCLEGTSYRVFIVDVDGASHIFSLTSCVVLEGKKNASRMVMRSIKPPNSTSGAPVNHQTPHFCYLKSLGYSKYFWLFGRWSNLFCPGSWSPGLSGGLWTGMVCFYLLLPISSLGFWQGTLEFHTQNKSTSPRGRSLVSPRLCVFKIFVVKASKRMRSLKKIWVPSLHLRTLETKNISPKGLLPSPKDGTYHPFY